MAHGGPTPAQSPPEPAPPTGAAALERGHAARTPADAPVGRRARLATHARRWRIVYLAALLSRALVLTVGFGTELVQRVTGADPERWRPFLHAETYVHYADVATRGYTLTNAYDYPLLPALMAGGSTLGVPGSITAFIVTNVCFVLGLVGTAVLGARLVGHAAAVRAATYLAIAPFAYWFSVASTEGLLLALVAGSVLLALRATPAAWLGAGALAALAALSRPPGALLGLLLLCIAVGQLRGRRLGRRGVAAALAAGAAIPAAVLGFFAYLGERTGDPLASLHAQEQFDRSVSLGGPVDALGSGLRATAGGSIGQAVELVATLGAIGLLGWFAVTCAGSRSEVRGWVLFGAASIALPLATGVLWQMPRFALLVPPVFWALGVLGARHPWVHRVILVTFPIALAVKVTTSVAGVAG